MRQLKGYEQRGSSDTLVIHAGDTSNGGASHLYRIEIGPRQNRQVNQIHFQEGPIKEHGVNGITHEALIDILIDRLHGFQSGEYHCPENALAITKLEEARHWLQHRTSDRQVRGVEGTSGK